MTLPIPVSGKRVLIVEDEFPIAQDLSEELAAKGASIVGFARSPEDALRILGSRTDVDMAIVDWHIDRKACEAVVQSLREQGTDVVLTTSYPAEFLPSEFRRLPCLVKPYDPSASFVE